MRTLLALLLLLPAAAAAVPPDPAGVAPPPPMGGPVQLKLLATIPVGHWPKGVVLTPSEDHAVVTSFSDNVLQVIDTGSLDLVRTIKTGRPSPVEIAFRPDGHQAIVPGGWEDDTVLVVDPRTWDIVHRLPGDDRLQFPKVVTYSPDGSRFYVTYWKSNTVGVYSSYSLELLAVVPAGVNPRGIAITPDGRKAYVANFDNAGDSVTVFDATPPFQVLTTIAPLPNPRHVVISRDGTSVFASLFGGSGGVVRIDTATDQVVARSRGTGLHGKTLALSPDGRWAFLANQGSDTLSILDASTLAEVARYPAGKEPCGLDVSSDGHRLWTTDWEGDEVRVYEIVVRAPGAPALLEMRTTR